MFSTRVSSYGRDTRYSYHFYFIFEDLVWVHIKKNLEENVLKDYIFFIS